MCCWVWRHLIMASRGEIAPQKLQEERHTHGRAGGKCETVIVHKLSYCFSCDRLCAIFSLLADVEVAAATEDGLGCCGNVLAVISFIVIIMFFPFSLLVSVKVSLRGKFVTLRADRSWWQLYAPHTCIHIDRERVRESCDPSSRSPDVREGQGTRALLYPAMPR